MDNEITINGVTYVRKATPDNQKYVFRNGCQYFTFYSCCPDVRLQKLQEKFPKLNSFFVGKEGYCGKVCLEVNIEDITVDFLKRLLYVSNDFFNIIENEDDFNAMVAVEMSRPTLHK